MAAGEVELCPQADNISGVSADVRSVGAGRTHADVIAGSSDWRESTVVLVLTGRTEVWWVEHVETLTSRVRPV